MLNFKQGGYDLCAKGRGGGKTPQKIVELLTEAVKNSSQSHIAKETGLTRLSVQRYLKGIGEPSVATLDKLSTYFKVSPAELMGDIDLGNLPELVGQFSGFDFDICSDEEKKILLFIMYLSSNDFLISLNQKPSQTVTKLLELAKSKKFTKNQLSRPIFKIAKKIINDFINKYEQAEDQIIEKQNE